MMWDLIFIFAAVAVDISFRLWNNGKKKSVKVPAWHVHIHTVEAAHKVTLPNDVYEALKVWLRGEGDSLFEITSDDAYLGLKRAHVVSVKGERK